LSEQPVTQRKTTIQVAAVSQHSGPLPPPEVLLGYEQTLKGCAERIVVMAESEQRHRHKLELDDSASRSMLARRGQWMAFCIGALGIVGGLVLASLDKDLAGGAAFVGSLGTLVGVYLYANRKSKTEAREHRQLQSK
jgi:uncharacterized membrane protein